MKINLIFLFSILVSVVISQHFHVSSADSLFYYQKLFSDWGIEADVWGNIEDPKKDASTEVSESTSTILLTSKKGRSSYLITKASFLNQYNGRDVMSDYKNVSIICDEGYEFGGEVVCGFDSVSGDYRSGIISLGNRSNSSHELAIFNTRVNSTNYILIPEQYLITPADSQRIQDYFVAITRSAFTEEASVESGLSTTKTFIRSTVYSNVFRTVIFAAFILIFAGLFKPLLIHTVHSPKKLLSKDTYQGLFNLLLKWIQDHSYTTSYILFIMILVYLPIVYLLSFRDTESLSPSYVYSYILDSTNPKNLFTYIQNESFIRLGLFFYNYVLLVLSLLLILPGFVDILSLSKRKLFGRTLYAGAVKVIFTVCILALFTLFLFTGISKAYAFATVILLVLSYTLLLASRSGIQIKDLYSRKQALVFLIPLLVLFVPSTIYKTADIDTMTVYDRESLIGVNDPIVILPYSKSFTDGVLFKDYIIDADYKIFIDSFLVHDPQFSLIHNKPIDQFEARGNFLLLAYSDNSYLQHVTRNPLLANYLSQSELSSVFTLNNMQENNQSENYAYLKFDCFDDLSSFDIRVNVYSSDTDSPDKVTIMRFPGCVSSQVEVEYRVPFNIMPNSNQFRIYEVLDFEKKRLSDFKIFHRDEELSVNFLKNYKSSPILYEVRTSPHSDILTVYSFDLKHELTSERSSPKVNISDYLNKMVLQGKLTSPFTIWSDARNVIIRNKFVEDK